MCGIIGAMAFGPKLNKAEELVRQDSMMYIVTELLQLTKIRGEDATGISTLFRNGVYHSLKMGVNSDKFTNMYGGKDTDYDGYLKMWKAAPQPAAMFMGHCRKSSVGNSWDNVNNHPIRVQDTIGIHNGTLKNHNQIFKQLKAGRDGTVDSEAIIRLLTHYSNNGADLFTCDMIEEVARRLEGTFSVLAYNGNNPFQMVTFRDGRPMEYAIVKPLKMVFIASEIKFFKFVFKAYNNMARLYDHKNFKPLVADDVEFEGLRQNGQAIFDLTREISADTKLADLCEEKTIPFQRIWKVGSAPVKSTSQASYGASNTSTTTNSSRKSSTIKKSLTEVERKNLKGLVWIKSLSKFSDVSAANVDEDKKTKSLEIDAKGYEQTTTTSGDDTGKANTKALTPTDNVETLVTGAADITQTTAGIKQEKQEVDMTVDPQAMEEADKASKELPTLEDITDVQEELEIVDIKALQSLPIPALCNRVRRATFKTGFYKGMIKAYETVDRETSPTTDTSGSNSTDKLPKAQNQIRMLKIVLSMFSSMVNSLKSSNNSSTSFKRVESAAKSAAVVSKKVNGSGSVAFNTLFSTGDLRDINLKTLHDAVDLEEE